MIDLFQIRTMLKALEQMYLPKLFFRSLFFRKSTTSDSESVDIDIFKGKRRLAPFVSPIKEGKMVERLGYTTRTYKPPYVKPKMITTAQHYLTRAPGQIIYGANRTPAQRAAEQLGKDMAELNQQIDRREEWMCAQALTTGKINVVGDGVNDVIDFGMDASHLITLSGTDLWSDTTNSDPMGDLKTWKRLIGKDSGIQPDAVVMGALAWDAFIIHPKTKDALDTRRIDLGLIDPKALPSGATWMGYLKETQQDVYTYDEYYLDDSAVVQSMMPEKKVIMGSTKARAEKLYGAIQDLEALFSVARFPKSWIEKDPSRRILLMQSAPLMSLHQVDAFICSIVLA